MYGDIVSDNLDDHPPIDKRFLEGAPSTAWRDFKDPKLRQFPRHGSKIKWIDYLGHGREGIVFKATIGDKDLPVAIKRPPPQPLPVGDGWREAEWPFEDGSRTVALLEKIRWAMADAAADSNTTIRIRDAPRRKADVIENLRAFSDEARHQSAEATPTAHDPTRPPPPFPSLPVCYGWTTVRWDELPRLDPPVQDEADERVDWHWAIIYEFVPGETGKTQDPAVGQSHLDFFYALGFALEAYKPDNWHGGRLVDLNDICSPFSDGWQKAAVRPRDAKKWFSSLGFVQDSTCSHKIVP
ncbi:hypothetical protein QBC40DRAFT_343372 [Triangularia verruculosa]|uniref:Protein kinase domain-containing protein n=1 Tax=Triangularia verruculosa TaxID=2587418 RepID=A0AAN6X7K3_9PEZI|nr:hypothetical protein QBC40DRAFT_343372 [Triangularia verruculosa]